MIIAIYVTVYLINGFAALFQHLFIYLNILFIVARNCAVLYDASSKTSGVYQVNPDGLGAFRVYCDQTTARGGWTVLQKRLDGSVDFYRGWDEYKNGFGDLNGEFWLGLDKIHRLTKQTQNKLRVDLEDFEGNTAYAEYDNFVVADEASDFTLSQLGNYSGENYDVGVFYCFHRTKCETSKIRTIR